mmetsp:Transcript_113883/g.318128  ORF Transcript_113883/g.318128 Transcript_113883/m.318128 type:complete len:202 (+) Transcript_113883:50-655(+)
MLQLGAPGARVAPRACSRRMFNNAAPRANFSPPGRSWPMAPSAQGSRHNRHLLFRRGLHGVCDSSGVRLVRAALGPCLAMGLQLPAPRHAAVLRQAPGHVLQPPGQLPAEVALRYDHDLETRRRGAAAGHRPQDVARKVCEGPHARWVRGAERVVLQRLHEQRLASAVADRHLPPPLQDLPVTRRPRRGHDCEDDVLARRV